jgi:hypothetical protein
MFKVKETKMMDPKMLLGVVNQKVAGIIPVSLGSEALSNMQFSIERNGQIEPVVVYKGMLYDGRHRCMCMRNLGRDVEAIVVDDEITTEEEVIEYITSKEMMGKDLTICQKAILTYERYIIGMLYSNAKAAKVGNVRRHYLGHVGIIKTHPYAISHNYIGLLKNDEAVALPNGKFTKSLATIVNGLKEYDENEASKTGSEISDRVQHSVDYTRALAEWDIDDKIGDTFWQLKHSFKLDTIDASCELLHSLLLVAYPRYKDDLTRDEVLLTIELRKKIGK